MNTDNLARCIETLNRSVKLYNQADVHSLEKDIFAHAIMKGYELVLDLSVRALKNYLILRDPTSREATQLVFKGIFLVASRLGLMSEDEAKRWCLYRRNNRNDAAYYYGNHCIDHLLRLIPEFIDDATKLINLVNQPWAEDPVVATPEPEMTLFNRFLELDNALHMVMTQVDSGSEPLAKSS